MDTRFSLVAILLLVAVTSHCFSSVFFPSTSGTLTSSTVAYNTTTSPSYHTAISNTSTPSIFDKSSEIESSTVKKSSLLDASSHDSRKTISELKCDEYAKEAANVTVTLKIPMNSTYFKEYEGHNPCKRVERKRRFITGGAVTIPGEYPHMVALGKYNSDRNFILVCGGTLISHIWVLSAAHCIHGPNGAPTHARIGIILLSDENSGFTIHIKTMVRHPDYNPPALYADIALMKLNTSVTFSNVIRAACLNQQRDFNNYFLTITGWGTTEIDGDPSDYLLSAYLSVIDNANCRIQHNITKEIPNGIASSMICAGSNYNRDTCHGDSGGPLQTSTDTCMLQVIGITSFGRGCAIKNSPGVYTRVSHYVPWIESIVWPQQK